MKPLAVLDSDVVFFLLCEPDPNAADAERERRRQAVEETISDLQKTHRFAIPAAAVAELGGDGDPEGAVERIANRLARLRILPLDYPSSRLAGKISVSALKRREGAERGAVKFDALICATAVHHGAECIVTENPRDFKRLLLEAGGGVRLVVPSRPPETGQLKLVHLGAKK